MNPLRYQFICDNLPESKKQRLDFLLSDINNENRKEIEENPFDFDEKTLQNLKFIEEKLDLYIEKTDKQKEKPVSLEKINEDLYVNF